jgi:hypothetical protein
MTQKVQYLLSIDTTGLEYNPSYSLFTIDRLHMNRHGIALSDHHLIWTSILIKGKREYKEFVYRNKDANDSVYFACEHYILKVIN